MKEVIRQTDRGEVELPRQSGRMPVFPTRIRPGSPRRVWGNAYLRLTRAFAPYITTKTFVRTVLYPDPARRLLAEKALSHTWLTSLTTPTKHDLCDTGMRRMIREDIIDSEPGSPGSLA